MTLKGIHPHMPASSPCPPQASSSHCKAILDLGKLLAAELDDQHDTLARWMAHHFARLIVEAEEDRSDRQAERRAAAAEAILRLWEHCSLLPDGHRPFEDLEPAIRTMESLDPRASEPRYAEIWSPRQATGSGGESEAQKWLQAAISVDHAARTLLRVFLRQAAHTATDKSREWVRLAAEAGVGEEQLLPIVRFIVGRTGEDKEPDIEEENRKLALGEIEQLEAFAKTATTVAQALREQLTSGELSKLVMPGGLDDEAKT